MQACCTSSLIVWLQSARCLCSCSCFIHTIAALGGLGRFWTAEVIHESVYKIAESYNVVARPLGSRTWKMGIWAIPPWRKYKLDNKFNHIYIKWGVVSYFIIHWVEGSPEVEFNTRKNCNLITGTGRHFLKCPWRKYADTCGIAGYMESKLKFCDCASDIF